MLQFTPPQGILTPKFPHNFHPISTQGIHDGSLPVHQTQQHFRVGWRHGTSKQNSARAQVQSERVLNIQNKVCNNSFEVYALNAVAPLYLTRLYYTPQLTMTDVTGANKHRISKVSLMTPTTFLNYYLSIKADILG